MESRSKQIIIFFLLKIMCAEVYAQTEFRDYTWGCATYRTEFQKSIDNNDYDKKTLAFSESDLIAERFQAEILYNFTKVYFEKEGIKYGDVWVPEKPKEYVNSCRLDKKFIPGNGGRHILTSGVYIFNTYDDSSVDMKRFSIISEILTELYGKPTILKNNWDQNVGLMEEKVREVKWENFDTIIIQTISSDLTRRNSGLNVIHHTLLYKSKQYYSFQADSESENRYSDF